MSEELTLSCIHLNDGSSIDKHAMSPAERAPGKG